MHQTMPPASLHPLCGTGEIDILVRMAGGGGGCASAPPDSEAAREDRQTALLRLIQWECVFPPSTRTDRPMRACDLRFTRRGLDLLELLDPLAAAFGRVKNAEHHLADFRELRASLEQMA